MPIPRRIHGMYSDGSVADIRTVIRLHNADRKAEWKEKRAGKDLNNTAETTVQRYIEDSNEERKFLLMHSIPSSWILVEEYGKYYGYRAIRSLGWYKSL